MPASDAQLLRLDADAAGVVTGQDLGEHHMSVSQVLQAAPPHGQAQAGADVLQVMLSSCSLTQMRLLWSLGKTWVSSAGPSGRFAGGALKRDASKDDDDGDDDDDAHVSVEHATRLFWHARLPCSRKLPGIVLIVSVSVFVGVTS